MPRATFTRDLQRLQDGILVLGSMVAQAIIDSVSALKKQDLESAQRIVEQDRDINERRFAIESDVLALIATQQPMAGDLRTLASILEIA
ncbi:MAG TPA: PhoU domain-containing protein, partial [Anaerolineae bacterium]|nr:PhoU domain-containing protein [Anaerolineae bacterium]